MVSMSATAGHARRLRQDLELEPERLRRRLDPSTLPFRTTAEVEPLVGTIGQPRALAAIERPDGDCDVFVDGARLERVAAAEDLAGREIPLRFTVDHQEFREIFKAPPGALSAARVHFSGPSGEPPWQHAAALLADGLIDGTFALTARGSRALAGRRAAQ
jgi:hypothetical protein